MFLDVLLIRQTQCSWRTRSFSWKRKVRSLVEMIPEESGRLAESCAEGGTRKPPINFISAEAAGIHLRRPPPFSAKIFIKASCEISCWLIHLPTPAFSSEISFLREVDSYWIRTGFIVRTWLFAIFQIITFQSTPCLHFRFTRRWTAGFFLIISIYWECLTFFVYHLSWQKCLWVTSYKEDFH